MPEKSNMETRVLFFLLLALQGFSLTLGGAICKQTFLGGAWQSGNHTCFHNQLQ